MKEVNNYSKLAMIGFVIAIVGTSISDLLTGVLRNYTVRGEVYSQTIGDLVSYLSGDLCLLFWAIAIRHKARFEKLTRCVMQLAIDYIIWDIIFLCYYNPYVWSVSKLKMYILSTITFLIIYYLEYLSLAQYYWVQKVKDMYANFKNKSNGRKS